MQLRIAPPLKGLRRSGRDKKAACHIHARKQTRLTSGLGRAPRTLGSSATDPASEAEEAAAALFGVPGSQ